MRLGSRVLTVTLGRRLSVAAIALSVMPPARSACSALSACSASMPL